MTDEKYNFETARVRLEEIAAEVRKKDTSLEKSLDLLEEGVRLANICTELVDHTDMTATASVEEAVDSVTDEDADGAEERVDAVGAEAIEAEVVEDEGGAGDVEDAAGVADTQGPGPDDGFEDDYDDLDEPSALSADD